MLGWGPNLGFTRCETGWVSEFRLSDANGTFTDIVEPLAEWTLKDCLPLLKEIVPEHCIVVTTCDWPITPFMPVRSNPPDIGYIITVTFDNEADEAEFIMKMS